MIKLRWLCTASVIGLLACAPGALAQDDGVMVDPDSPAGAEYDIPIDRAREGGAKKKAPKKRAQDRVEGRPSAPFGEGVDDDDAAQGSDGGTSGGSGGSSGGGGGDDGSSAKDRDGKDGKKSDRGDTPTTPSTPTTTSSDPVTTVDRAAVIEAAETESSGPGDAAIVTILGIAVVATGALAGWMLRRRRIDT